MSNASDNSLPAAWLQPLALPGGHALPNRILPGPMEGITAGSFCRVMAGRGLVRAWVTPFIRISTGVPRLSRLEGRLAAFLDSGSPEASPSAATTTPVPVIVQVMGTDIPLLAAAAARLAAIEGVIGIDLNCACPSRIVIAGGAGGARLRDPAWIRRALEALRLACPHAGISVKLRSGFADSAEMPAILEAVRAAAPDFAVLHFRTVAEMYQPVNDGWARLARARELLPATPLFGSGDLFSPAAALRLFHQAGVDGITPARGLLGNPWLLRDIEAACRGDSAPRRTVREKKTFLRELISVSAADDSWRPGFVLELARHQFGADSPFFRRLAAARTADAMLAVCGVRKPAR